MEKDKGTTKRKRSLLAKTGRFFAIFFLSLIALVVLVLVLIQTAPVQDFARKKIVSFLQTKLNTRVEIARLDVDFPKMLVLEGVYLEDKTKDTLVAGGQLKLDIDMFKLIKGEVQINEINLNRITAKIKRQMPDTVFNFQFITDAFASAPSTTKDTSSLKIAINKIIVDKTRLVFNDVVTGNDVDVYINHFDTHISTFDLSHLAFDVPDITLQGVRGRVRQFKPIEVMTVVKNPDTALTNEKAAFLRFSNKKTLLSDVDVDYSNSVANMSALVQLKALNIYPKDINLETSTIVLDKIDVNAFTGKITMGKTQGNANVIKMTDDSSNEITEPLPWKVSVNNLNLDNNNFAFNDESQPRLTRGMDFAHLDISDLTFHLQDFYFHNDTIQGQVTKGNMSEKSGFKLNTFETKFAYNDKGVELKDLLLQTPGTEIKRTAVIRYPSLAAIQKNPGLLELNIDLDNSKVQVKDILTFMPSLASQPALKNPSATFYIDGLVTGSVSRLNIDHFNFRGFQQTYLDVAGTVTGLPDPNKVAANLNIRSFKTGRSDIMLLAPPNTIPSNITIPQTMSLTGSIKGNASQATTDMLLNTSLGSAALKGTISNAANKDAAIYNANLRLNRLNVGALIQKPDSVGLVTANISVTGRGYNPDKARIALKGNIVSAEILKYNYRNLAFDGSLVNQHFTANANINDPNIHFALKASGDMGGELPGFNLVADIDSIKTQPLHLTPDLLVYRGKIEANFPTLNLDALEGQAYITNSLLVMNNQRVSMDSVSLIASYQNNEQVISLGTDFINADIKGTYKLAQLGDIMLETIQPYFALDTTTKKATFPDPYDFTINANITDHPTLRAFVPTLTRLDPVNLNARFSTADGMNAKMTAPFITMGTNTIEGVDLTATTNGTSLDVATNVELVKSGASLALYKTGFTTSLADNKANFGLVINDKTNKNKYRLSGLLAQGDNNSYSLSLKPDSLLLNYDPWTIAPENLLRFGPNIVSAQNFSLSRNNQQLVINSTTAAANSPLEVKFNNFKIATLTAFVQSDSLIADGTINGNVVLKDLLTQPNFNTDLTISDITINKDTLGNLNAKVNNTTPDVFNTNITLTGNGNDLSLTGNYYMKPADNSNLDFDLNINKIQMASLEGPSMGMVTNASGFINGNVKVSGATTAPKILGGINFNQTDFTVTMLNSQFKVDNETIKVDNEGIRFSTFTVKDSANNNLVIDGEAYTTNFTNYKFDMKVTADDFRAINSKKSNNALYYGQLYFSTNLNIKGTETSPVVDGRLSVNDKTNLSLVIPQPEPGLVDRTGVIEFVDMDAPQNDSLFLAMVKSSYDSSFNKSQLTGFDISANIEISKEASFNIIVDEANGDFLNLKGQAILNGGIDPSGKITLTGTYEIESGGYELSFNFLRRKFVIEKGGKITWTGEPTTGDINVTAIYIANTSAIDLVGDQLGVNEKNQYLQKLPFEVHLNVTGELMQPILTFDILLPTDKNLRVSGDVVSTVNTRLDQLKTEPSELNKQVFALLLLNRFVSQNPFESSGGGGGFNAGIYARQSVSRILTEQLNKLATDLVAGIEVNFDINSTEDYTTGQSQARTDLGVNLSKRLLNDRLKVNVGSNFELEGPQQVNKTGTSSGVIGNVSVDYSLTKDGKYLLRGYQKNDYDIILEGYVIETGLKFIMTVDYDKFRQIFQQRKQRRSLKKADRQQVDSTKNTTVIFAPAPAQEKDKQVTEPADKLAADNRTRIPVVNKELNDEN